MICPVCKSDMIVVEYNNIELDFCTECRGVWFDAGELELLLKIYNVVNTESLKKTITEAKETASTEQKRKCPICNSKMDKTILGKEPGALIDSCRNEHGLWFDGGEITQLVAEMAGSKRGDGTSGNKVLDFIEEIFNAPQSQEEKNNSYRT
ncbi:zf-TFIIB domain-containing protein [Chloroflexota bacterium]